VKQRKIARKHAARSFWLDSHESLHIDDEDSGS
jgi:hypothetical protein